VTTVPAVFQVSLIGVAGRTESDAATDVRSIAVVNVMVAGASAATPVATAVRKAACGSGTIVLGAVAMVGAGRASAMAPRPRMAPRPTATPVLASAERRRNDPA